MSKEYPLLIGYSGDGSKELHNVQEVAEFICKNGLSGDVSITLPDGAPFIDTFGMYLNRIADMEYREELLTILIPMQMGIESAVFGTADDDESPALEMQGFFTANFY